MGVEIFPIYIFIRKIIMKIEKKLIKETFNIKEENRKTFSNKKQNIIISESQLEMLLVKLNKK